MMNSVDDDNDDEDRRQQLRRNEVKKRYGTTAHTIDIPRLYFFIEQST